MSKNTQSLFHSKVCIDKNEKVTLMPTDEKKDVQIKDRLELIFELQSGLASMMRQDRYPKDTEDKISGLCTAIMHEAVELQRTTNWKWWKTPTDFNKADAKEELIDIWHFVVQASLELGLTPDDILAEYKRKNEINRNRQRDGY